MTSKKKRVKRRPMSERRRLRNGCVADALRLQLDACRKDADLAAIVVSDELGFCVAHSGGDGNHEELAARLPLLADPAQRWAVEEDADLRASQRDIAITTFPMGGAKLYVCAVRKPLDGINPSALAAAADDAILARVASGFTRLLA